MLNAVALSAFLLAPGTAAAGDARDPSAVADDVFNVIQDIVYGREDAPFNYFEVKVQGDIVILSGTVRFASRGRQIAGEVEKIDGVREVRNQLHSPSVGAGDERLRREMLRGIYGSLSLSRYALQRLPPIRILVERGKVVLAGRVATRVERDLLTTIADRSSAFEVENRVELDPAVANVPVGGAGVRF